jgi:import inner membrane translocase subunit TIM23
MSSTPSSSQDKGQVPALPDTSQDATSFLRNASFRRAPSPQAVTEQPDMSASDLLSGGTFDVSKLHPMAQISDSIDYLTLEDDKKNTLPGSETALPSRGWSDDLCYGTGTTYLSGAYQIPDTIVRA